MTIPQGVKDWVGKYGAFVAFAASIPGVAYLSMQPGPAERFKPLLRIERPGAAALRASDGPPDAAAADAIARVTTPTFVKGIYVSSATAGTKKRFDELVDLVDRTELNAMVIDIKDWRGAIAFVPESEALKPYAAETPELGDLRAFTKPLKEKGIYLIARQFVFQDPWIVEKRPEFAVKRIGGGIWRDRRGTPWIDPASKEAWKYNVAVAREAFAGGFDEVQLDYIRFLSDGDMKAAVYPVYDGTTPKSEVISSFFAYVDAELREKSGIPISADLFGLTMWQHDYDLNIGQRLEPALRHFDFVSPMVYPSHYPAGFMGFPNPSTRPYEVIKANMLRGQKVLDKLHAEDLAARTANPDGGIRVGSVRPWLQDFDLGADYTPDMVRAQMRATEEGGGSGWLFWNARNVYTESAFAPVEKKEAQ